MSFLTPRGYLHSSNSDSCCWLSDLGCAHNEEQTEKPLCSMLASELDWHRCSPTWESRAHNRTMEELLQVLL